MIEKEDFKSDPEPYLYISMTLIKIYEDEEMKMEYEDAGGDPLKDALKYATKANKYYSKCLKKDITTFEMEDNMEFFNNLTMIALDEIIYHYNEDKYSKAASGGKKLAKVFFINKSKIFFYLFCSKSEIIDCLILMFFDMLYRGLFR